MSQDFGNIIWESQNPILNFRFNCLHAGSGGHDGTTSWRCTRVPDATIQWNPIAARPDSYNLSTICSRNRKGE